VTLHEYTIIGHKRSEIGRYLGLASVALAPAITGLVTWLAQWPLLTTSLRGKMLAFTVSTGIVYAILYWLFNRYGWRLVDKMLGIPNLGGAWAIAGSSKTLEGEEKYPWTGNLSITQRWDRIAVELKTNQSGSHSETASVLLLHDGKAKLSYSYQNHPNVGEAALNKHQGFCELIFDPKGQSAEGHYFNSLGRYSFGSMKLVKQPDSN
jgi:hypothetical protein